MPQENNGFTLIELAMVLVIIALVIGAIVVGQGMVRSAQILSVVDDVSNYKQAIKLFQDKYQYLPGDMPTATTFWGYANSDPVACRSTPATGTLTCDGNGDGHIGDRSDTLAAQSESYHAWQHLANAGLIKGSYSGVPGPLSGPSLGILDDTIGVNIPASALMGAGYVISWSNPTPLNNVANVFPATAGYHYIQLGMDDGGITSGTNGSLDAPALSVAEAFALDAKVDDGLPGTGSVQSWAHNSTAPNCATGSDATAQYDNTKSGLQCVMIFGLGF